MPPPCGMGGQRVHMHSMVGPAGAGCTRALVQLWQTPASYMAVLAWEDTVWFPKDECVGVGALSCRA